MTPRNNKNWNFSVFVFGSISSRNVDPGSCTHAGRRKRGAVVAAHPGLVGDEEAAAKEVAGDEGGEVAGVDDDAEVEELEQLRRLRLSEVDEDVEEGAVVPFHGSGEADGDHGAAAAR
jgi:hypothetical protein